MNTEIQELEQAFTIATQNNDTDMLNAIAVRMDELDAAQAEREKPGMIGRGFNAAADMFTGSERTTPEIDALPDVSEMPVTDSAFDILQGLKISAGTILADGKETARVLQENIPGLEVRQDAKGNYIFKSPYDSKEYAYKPGFQLSDVPKTIAGALAFTPAGRAATLPRAAGGAALTQTGIEGAQKAAGGTFDPEQIPLAGAMEAGGNIIGRGINAAFPGSRAAGEVLPEDAVVKPVMSDTDMIETTIKAGSGAPGNNSMRKMIGQSQPDAEILASAQRLGITDYIQPDHVSTNQSFKELAAAVRSFPGSDARRIEDEGLLQVAKRADDLIEELGGTQDYSGLNASIRTSLEKTQQELEQRAEDLYKQINTAIPPKAEARADNLLAFLNNKADDLGGEEFLSAEEKRLMSQLAPRDIPGGETSYPTYARLDGIRKSLTAARVKKEGAFKDAESGLIKKLEKELLIDQQAVAAQYGVEDVFNTARQSVAVRKGVESDMKALFGRNLDKSLVQPLITATKRLSKGDVSGLTTLLTSVPQELRGDMVATGLNAAFGKTAKRGDLSFSSYMRWFDGLNQNSQAKNLLFANLPAKGRERLTDLYNISKGIAGSTKERITTGRIGVVKENFTNIDTLMDKIYNGASKAKGLAASEGAATAVGVPGAGIAGYIAAGARSKKDDAIKAADNLFKSPLFIENAKKGTPESAEKIAKSKPFQKYLKALGNRQRIGDPVQFIMSAFQTERNINGTENDE